MIGKVLTTRPWNYENPIENMIAILQLAERIGAETDTPEGARYIQISDTLANQLTKDLQAWLDDMEADGYDGMGDDA